MRLDQLKDRAEGRKLDIGEFACALFGEIDRSVRAEIQHRALPPFSESPPEDHHGLGKLTCDQVYALTEIVMEAIEGGMIQWWNKDEGQP